MSDLNSNSSPTQANPSATDDRTVGAVAPTVVQSLASTPPVTQPVEPQTPARAKELGSPSAPETTPLVEVSTGAGAIEQEPIPEEVEAWMEKVGTERGETGFDNLPAVQVQAPTPPSTQTSQPAYVLPLGEEEMKTGMKASVNDSIKWLATWCQKIIKQLKGQAAYRQSS